MRPKMNTSYIKIIAKNIRLYVEHIIQTICP